MHGTEQQCLPIGWAGACHDTAIPRHSCPPTLRPPGRYTNQRCRPHVYVQVAWSFAKLDWPAPRVLRHAGAQLAAHTAAFSDKEASNVLWALASQVRGDGPRCVGGHAVRREPSWKVACMSNSVPDNAFAPIPFLVTPLLTHSGLALVARMACRGWMCQRQSWMR